MSDMKLSKHILKTVKHYKKQSKTYYMKLICLSVPLPGLHSSHLLPWRWGRQTHCPERWSQAVPANVPRASQWQGWQPRALLMLRLYICSMHWLHRGPVTPALQGHCPVALSQSREPFTVPAFSQLHGRQRKEWPFCTLWYPSRHSSQRLPPIFGLHAHCPVLASHVVPEMDPAASHSQALQPVTSSP